MARMQAIGGTNRPNILGRKFLTLFHVLHNEERTPKRLRRDLMGSRSVLCFAQGFLRRANCLDQGSEFRRLKGKIAVGPAIGARERQMLLDYGGAQRDGSNSNGNSG